MSIADAPDSESRSALLVVAPDLQADSEEAERLARSSRRRVTGDGRNGHDLRPTQLSIASSEDWGDPEAALVTLFRRAEANAIDAIEWYLEDKQRKSWSSQLLRALAILLAVAGGLLPLIAAARPGSQFGEWGFVFLGAAAGWVAFDRFFGLSTAWVRDTLGAQALQQRLERFQYEWAASCADTYVDDSVNNRLTLLREFAQDVMVLVRHETKEWVKEFQGNLAGLEAMTANGLS